METAANEGAPAGVPRNILAGLPVAVALIALAKFLVQLATAHRYGYFRDELYYIACSRHLAWGYVDQPPLVAVAAWLELHLGGSSLTSLRFLPALSGALVVALAAVLARELGAGRFGMAFAALATACVAVNFTLDYLFTMNAFEPLFWMGCALVVVRIVNTGDQRMWLWFGVLAGLGLENKYSMAFFAAGLVAGVLLTPERRSLLRPWLWMGGALAFLIFLPNLIWNVQHHWPFLELMRNIRASGRDVVLGPAEYFKQQMLIVGPVLAPLWILGLGALFFGPRLGRYRALAWAYVFSFAFIVANKGKNYYLAPAYPMLLAAGAVAVERFVERTRQTWIRVAAVALIVTEAILLLPLGVPVLSAEGYLRYQSKLPFAVPVSEKSHQGAAMPQYYSDQFGWEEMTAAVARIYHALPADEQAEACIGGANYGEAAAIDFFGPKYGLPHAISTHQSYFLWGPGNCNGQVLILLGERGPDAWRERCARVDVAAQLYHPYAILGEDRPVIVCHGFKASIPAVWPMLKNWD